MNGKKLLSVILTFMFFLVCGSACQASTPPQTEINSQTPEEIRTALGDGNPTVIFSLTESREAVTAVGKFDFENHTVLLNSGYTMPIMGLGTYALDHDTCVNSVKALLQNGGSPRRILSPGDPPLGSAAGHRGDPRLL